MYGRQVGPRYFNRVGLSPGFALCSKGLPWYAEEIVQLHVVVE